MTTKRLWSLMVLAIATLLVGGCGDEVAATPPTLVSVTDEPQGASCPNGGQRIQTGLDLNEDGQLNSDEVDSEDYVCNGAQGVQGSGGATSLLNIEDIAPSTTCPEGGKRVESGRDVNDDKILDDAEIEATHLICNGDVGTSVLVSFSDEPAGSRCIRGGRKMDVGTDSNRDGILDAEEIESTQYICNGGEIVTRVTNFERGSEECPGGGLRFESGLDNNANGSLQNNEVDFVQDVCNRFISEIAASTNHSCALRSDGALFCWGDNQLEQLGVPPDDLFPEFSTSLPMQVPTTSHYVSLSVGFGHTCALEEGGDLECWGQGDQGQLGQELTTPTGRTYEPQTVMVDVTPMGEPTPVYEALTGIAQFELGESHSCAVLSGGTASCWGSNSHGQVGDGRVGVVSIGEEVNYATQVLTAAGDPPQVLSGAQKVSAGDVHTCALMLDQTVWCWGGNGLDQLGDAAITDLSTVAVLTPVTSATDIAAGDDHTCALMADQTVNCWGNNAEGQLGADPTITTSSATPVVVTTDGATPLGGVVSLAVGVDASCAVVTSGEIYCWGLNDEGQLGTPIPSVAPFNTFHATRVAAFDRAHEVSVGGAHTCATRDGEVFCWGRNDENQLGNGGAPSSRYASKVPLDLAP